MSVRGLSVFQLRVILRPSERCPGVKNSLQQNVFFGHWCGKAGSQRSCQMAATQIERTNAKRCVSESRTGFKNDADATSEPSEGGPADWTRRKAQAYCVLS